MRSKIYLILFALFAFSCSSDSSSDDYNNGENNNNGGNNNSGNALLVSEILVDQGENGSMNFNYDGNKLTYISSNDFGDNELLNFIYTNNKISRIDRSYDTSQGIYSRWNFSYDNQNRLSYYEHCYFGDNNNNECESLKIYSLTYSSNNTVTYEVVGSDGEDADTHTLQLDNNGNIIGISGSYEDEDENGNLVTISASESLEYDNFNSPFKNITGMNAFIVWDVICRNESVYLLGFNAFNNCISSNVESSDETEIYTDTYAYDYNDDNYPRQIIVSENNSSYEERYDISYY